MHLFYVFISFIISFVIYYIIIFILKLFFLYICTF